jgi:diguanylate cyclase (GGDEF)-like protein
MLRNSFPDNGGTIFLFRESRNLLEPAGAWGGSMEPRAFAPDECLAIRLGRTYRVDPGETKVHCRHVGEEMAGYACIPMAAQGVVHGVLTLALGPDKAANTEATHLAEMVVERLALAVANVRLRKQLRDISIQDSLTGLYNRRFAEEVMSHEIAQAARHRSALCVLMLDLDHFKRFNDTYGHEVGDKLLQQVGALLKATFRGSDVCCRYGGEEFLVVMPDADVAGAVQRAEGLREEMKRIHFIHGGVVIGNVSVSIGLASYPDPISDGRSLVAAADSALYKAKAAGRDRVCVATGAAS